MKRKLAWIALATTLAAAVFAACSWIFIDWDAESVKSYPGGTVLSGRLDR